MATISDPTTAGTTVKSICIEYSSTEGAYEVKINGDVVAYAATAADGLREAQIELHPVNRKVVPVELTYTAGSRGYWLRWDNGHAETYLSNLRSAVNVLNSLTGRYRRVYPVFRYYPTE